MSLLKKYKQSGKCQIKNISNEGFLSTLKNLFKTKRNATIEERLEEFNRSDLSVTIRSTFVNVNGYSALYFKGIPIKDETALYKALDDAKKVYQYFDLFKQHLDRFKNLDLPLKEIEKIKRETNNDSDAIREYLRNEYWFKKLNKDIPNYNDISLWNNENIGTPETLPVIRDIKKLVKAVESFYTDYKNKAKAYSELYAKLEQGYIRPTKFKSDDLEEHISDLQELAYDVFQEVVMGVGGDHDDGGYIQFISYTHPESFIHSILDWVEKCTLINVSKEGIFDDIVDFFTGKKTSVIDYLEIKAPKTFVDKGEVIYKITKDGFPHFDILKKEDPIEKILSILPVLEKVCLLTRDIDNVIKKEQGYFSKLYDELEKAWDEGARADSGELDYDEDNLDFYSLDDVFDYASDKWKEFEKRNQSLTNKLEQADLWRRLMVSAKAGTTREYKLKDKKFYQDAYKTIIDFKNKYGNEIGKWEDRYYPSNTEGIDRLISIGADYGDGDEWSSIFIYRGFFDELLTLSFCGEQVTDILNKFVPEFYRSIHLSTTSKEEVSANFFTEVEAKIRGFEAKEKVKIPDEVKHLITSGKINALFAEYDCVPSTNNSSPLEYIASVLKLTPQLQRNWYNLSRNEIKTYPGSTKWFIIGVHESIDGYFPLVLDFDPNVGGTYGQVIEVKVEQGKVYTKLIADSLTNLYYNKVSIESLNTLAFSNVAESVTKKIYKKFLANPTREFFYSKMKYRSCSPDAINKTVRKLKELNDINILDGYDVKAVPAKTFTNTFIVDNKQLVTEEAIYRGVDIVTNQITKINAVITNIHSAAKKLKIDTPEQGELEGEKLIEQYLPADIMQQFLPTGEPETLETIEGCNDITKLRSKITNSLRPELSNNYEDLQDFISDDSIHKSIRLTIGKALSKTIDRYFTFLADIVEWMYRSVRRQTKQKLSQESYRFDLSETLALEHEYDTSMAVSNESLLYKFINFGLRLREALWGGLGGGLDEKHLKEFKEYSPSKVESLVSKLNLYTKSLRNLPTKEFNTGTVKSENLYKRLYYKGRQLKDAHEIDEAIQDAERLLANMFAKIKPGLSKLVSKQADADPEKALLNIFGDKTFFSSISLPKSFIEVTEFDGSLNLTKSMNSAKRGLGQELARIAHQVKLLSKDKTVEIDSDKKKAIVDALTITVSGYYNFYIAVIYWLMKSGDNALKTKVSSESLESFTMSLEDEGDEHEDNIDAENDTSESEEPINDIPDEEGADSDDSEDGSTDGESESESESEVGGEGSESGEESRETERDESGTRRSNEDEREEVELDEPDEEKANIAKYLEPLVGDNISELTLFSAKEINRPLYHISMNPNIQAFIPQVSKRTINKEDRSVPRISTSTSLIGCLNGYQSMVSDMEGRATKNFSGLFKVYELPYQYAIKPSGKLLADVGLSDEYWLISWKKETYRTTPVVAADFTIPKIEYVYGKDGKDQTFHCYIKVHRELYIDHEKKLSRGFYHVTLHGYKYDYPLKNNSLIDIQEISENDYNKVVSLSMMIKTK